MNCKNCNSPMERVFRFGTDGKASRTIVCPRCGAEVPERELTYTDEGDVIIATDKKGNPTLAYQVHNPEANNYGGIVKVKQKPVDKDKPAQGEKRNKPFNRNKKKRVKPNAD